MKYWKINRSNKQWLFLTTSLPEKKVPISKSRKIILELKSIEEKIKPPIKGWIMYVKLSTPHVMIMCIKLGGVPYEIKRGVIWFKKELL